MSSPKSSPPSSSPSSSSQSPTADVFARIEREQEGYLAELQDYLRIPSISTDPAYAAEVRRCAEFLRAKMEQAGLAAELIETPKHPLVYGEWLGAEGAPTLLFYGHYDVQPPDPLEEWRSPPFEPTIEGEHLVARGATDDKGQSFAHLKAVAAMLAERGRLPVNVKFLVEGEEESGGESIEAYVSADRGRRLACDAVVVSDSSMYGPGQPSLLYGLKGLLYTEVRVSGPARDLHSGTFGGAVTNPLNALAEIVSKLRDPRSGRVLIPGFYDDVQPLEEWERAEFAKLPFDAEQYRNAIGVPELFGEQGYSTLERAWVRPTCDVNGIWGGYQGPGAKTVIAAKGAAKVSMRLVPDQDPKRIAELFTQHVKAVAPPGVRVAVEVLHHAPPVLIDTDVPIAHAALDAMEEVWGRRPVRVREGGSIPIVSTFVEALGAPVLLLGFGLSDDRLHSPNEKFDIPNFYGGIRSIARLLDRIAEPSPVESP
jgi:acetylornithine deacetylase/succinyl-diaminopimelate desuccinylase-like protein